MSRIHDLNWLAHNAGHFDDESLRGELVKRKVPWDQLFVHSNNDRPQPMGEQQAEFEAAIRELWPRDAAIPMKWFSDKQFVDGGYYEDPNIHRFWMVWKRARGIVRTPEEREMVTLRRS